MEVLLKEMADPGWRDADRPLVQLVRDWHAFPETRGQLLTSEPGEDADPTHVLKIAAVIHALCDYSGCDVPSWALRHNAARDFELFRVPGMVGVTSMVRNNAAPACRYHGVWFTKEFVQPKRLGMVNPYDGMSEDEFRGMLNYIEPEPMYA